MKIAQLLRVKQCRVNVITQKHLCTSESSSKWKPPSGYDTQVKLYNPLTKSKVPLISKRQGVLSWYSCGPTVYDSAHIGHASCYVKLDIIRRVLDNYFGTRSVYVMGVTDIDDKIIRRANQLNETCHNISKAYEQEFFDDLHQLNVLEPTAKVRVTDHIPHVVEFIQTLISSGHGYVTNDGSVYFDVSKFPSYGKLEPAQRKTESDSEKQSNTDFALWKSSKEGEPWWDSPWGKGRPGWHIECSAMASNALGSNIDIHSGGIDLRFPHHENEEAMSCAHHCTSQWINYWIHTGHLHCSGDTKMSKSLKNTIGIREFLEDYSANHFRMFCLMSRYRYQAEYSPDSISSAVALCNKFDNCILNCKAFLEGRLNCDINEPEVLKEVKYCEIGIRDALADDFDTPKVLTLLIKLANCLNSMLSRPQIQIQSSRPIVAVAAGASVIQDTLDSIGYDFRRKEKGLSDERTKQIINTAIDFRAVVRNTTRSLPSDSASEAKKKLFKACDDFRNTLLINGVEIQDKGKDTLWNFSNNVKQVKTAKQ